MRSPSCLIATIYGRDDEKRPPATCENVPPGSFTRPAHRLSIFSMDSKSIQRGALEEWRFANANFHFF
jgi:hypothetical protein